MAEERNMYIPLDIVEEILFKHPVKSLLRLSAVSKAWNTMISDARFIKQHRTAAALPTLIIPWSSSSLTPASSFSLLSNQNQNETTIAAASSLFCPFESKERVILLASSGGDFWCVKKGGSLFIWNPSMGAYKRLPSPAVLVELETMNCSTINLFSFGMGYDSVADDYKILKIPIFGNYYETELYSLRSNSWRIIPSFPQKQRHITPSSGVFVSGALHWVALSPNGELLIVSFDLTTEMYAEVERPPSCLPVDDELNKMELTILREKLCVGLNDCSSDRFVLWEMQEYGDPKSWTKMFEIDVQDFIPYVYTKWQWRYNQHGPSYVFVKPLYLYDNGMLLIEVMKAGFKNRTIFMYSHRDEPQIVFHINDTVVGPLYVESLISPTTYSRPR